MHSSFADDALSTGSIGFAFKYNAIDYTSIKVNSNGWASFGTTTSNTTYTPLSSAASSWSGSHHPCLSPLGADLQGNTNGAVRIQTIGSAPNRVCIIQWKNWRRYGGSQNFNFQIRLYETTNVVQFVYGTMVTTSSASYDCGITGNTNADFNIRTSTTSWSASTVGTANTQDMTVSNSVFPASGQEYTWTPPPFPTVALSSITPSVISCATTDPRQVVVDASITLGSLTSVVLNYSFNGVAQTPIPMTNSSGTTYTATIPAATPANAIVTWNVLATSSFTTASSYAGTAYQDQTLFGVSAIANNSISPVCSGSTSNLSISLNSLQASALYNTPSVGSPTSDEDFGSVVITEGATTILSNTTVGGSLVGTIGTASGTPGSFSNFTAFGPYAMTAGSTYNFSLTSITQGGNWGNSMAIFIDYNRDGDFADAGEAAYLPAATVSGPHVETGSFTIPTTALNGQTRMRVVCLETLITGVGSTNPWGEYEDYMLNISSPNTGGGLAPAITSVAWTNSTATALGTGNPLAINPTTDDSYSAIVTAAGCTVNSSATSVTILALPTSPTATNSTQCGTQVPTASVASAAGVDGTGMFYWYDAATAGNVVQNPPVASTWTTFFTDDFSGATVAAGAVISGSANLTNVPGWLELTSETNSLQGGITVNAGVNAQAYKVEFDVQTTTGGADGFSWSFAPDASATATLPSAEQGTGTKVKISFDAYGAMPNGAGTYLLYNNTATSFNATTAGVLAFNAATPWLGSASAHVIITISEAGLLTLNVDGTDVFSNVALPAAYLTENKSAWKHVVSARTGGINMLTAIDNLSVAYKMYAAGSTTYNSPLASNTTFYVAELGVNGCYSPLAPVEISVSQPAPIVYNNSATGICLGESVTISMSSTITPAYTYEITSPNAGAGVASTVTGSTHTFTPTAAGTMPYIVTATNGNCTEVDTVNIMVNNFIPAAPIAVDSVINICAGVTSQNVAVTPSISAPGVITSARTGLSKAIINTLTDGTQDTLTVGTLPLGATVTGLSVGLNITHTWNSDMQIYLTSPNGIEIELSTGNGGSGDNYTNTVFSTNATTPITAGFPSATSPFTGTFLPEGNLAQFLNGTSGQWILRIVDLYGGDDGTLTSWSVNVQYSLPAATAWYQTPTSTTVIGTTASIEAIGTPVMSAPAAIGTYTFYAAAQDNVPGGCFSATRTPVTVNVVSVLADIVPIDASCNSVANGSFTLGTVSCGTSPFTYSVDGGAFGAIPTDLAYGNHTVIIKDANDDVAPAATIFIDQPTWITNGPNFVANGWACKDETSEVISAANPNLQPTETLLIQNNVSVPAQVSWPTPGNYTTTFNLNLPVGATVTSASLLINGLTTTGFTYASDLDITVSGLGSLSVTPSVFSMVNNLNLSYPLTSINSSSNTVTVSIDHNYSGTATISNISLLVSYTINQTLDNITWYAAPTGGTSLGSGFTLETVGTSVLPNTATPGVYNFYAQGELDGCSSFTRQLVTVEIQAPTIVANLNTSTVCPGDFLTLNATGGLTYTWSNGAGQNTPFVPAPTNYVGATQSYVVNGFDIDGCANQDTVVVTVLPQPILNAGVDQAVCDGTPVILNASTTSASATPVTSFQWNNNVPNNTQFVPTNTATLTVTATGANGCTTQDAVLITVLALPVVDAGQDITVCAGFSATLNAAGAVSYAWNNGVVQGIPFYPNATQTYTVVGTAANGCTNQDQVVLTISTGPTVTVSGPQVVCANAPASLSAATTNSMGGFWTTSNGTGVISPNVSNGTVTYTPSANDPAVVNLTYIASNVCGNVSQATTLTVLPVPTVDAGPDVAACSGLPVTLTATGTGFLTWNNGVSNNVAFVPTTSGTYTVTAVGTNNCSNTDQMIVTVLALPDVNAGADQTICSGSNITLSGSGANSYAWNNAVVNNVAFAPSTTQTYTVTGTAINGCQSSDDVVVTVNATPVAAITVIDDITLAATPAGMNYQWINCASGTDIPAATTADFTATVNGAYAVIVTSLQGCEDESDCITIDAVGLDQLATIEMSVQPNPTLGELTIKMPTTTKASAQVFDAQGKLIQTELNVVNGTVLNLASLTTGVYMVRVSAENAIQTFRVVKQ